MEYQPVKTWRGLAFDAFLVQDFQTAVNAMSPPRKLLGLFQEYLRAATPEINAVDMAGWFETDGKYDFSYRDLATVTSYEKSSIVRAAMRFDIRAERISRLSGKVGIIEYFSDTASLFTKSPVALWFCKKFVGEHSGYACAFRVPGRDGTSFFWSVTTKRSLTEPRVANGRLVMEMAGILFAAGIWRLGEIVSDRQYRQMMEFFNDISVLEFTIARMIACDPHFSSKTATTKLLLSRNTLKKTVQALAQKAAPGMNVETKIDDLCRNLSRELCFLKPFGVGNSTKLLSERL